MEREAPRVALVLNRPKSLLNDHLPQETVDAGLELIPRFI